MKCIGAWCGKRQRTQFRQRKKQERVHPKMEPLKKFIDDILEMDCAAPRKPRHTARRIWRRLASEKPEYPVAESTVREYVRGRKRAMAWLSAKYSCRRATLPGRISGIGAPLHRNTQHPHSGACLHNSHHIAIHLDEPLRFGDESPLQRLLLEARSGCRFASPKRAIGEVDYAAADLNR